jgi:hypothetical protein
MTGTAQKPASTKIAVMLTAIQAETEAVLGHLGRSGP